MRKRASHICSTTRVRVWPGESLHPHRPPAGFLTIRIASSIHFSVSCADTRHEPSGAVEESTFSSMAPSVRGPGRGAGGDRTAAERGGRGLLLPGRQKRARHPGAICGRTQASRTLVSGSAGRTESAAAPLQSTPPSSAPVRTSAPRSVCAFRSAPSTAAALQPEVWPRWTKTRFPGEAAPLPQVTHTPGV